MSPGSLRAFFSRILGLVRRGRHNDRLSEEIQAHLDLLADERMRDGMSPRDARLAARRAFGGVDQVKEICRDQRGFPLIDALGQDFRFAVRLLAKDKGFTVAAVVALGLGIGVNTTVFTIANAMNLRDLPVERPEQIMAVHNVDADGGRTAVSFADFRDWQPTVHTFVGIAAYTRGFMNIGDDDRATEQLSGTFVSANAFSVLRVRPLLGRDFRADDDQAGAPPVAILAHTVWTDRYGRDPAVVGRTIRVNGVSTAIIGVMPEGFRFPVLADLWQPLALLPDLAPHERDARTLGVFGRLQDARTREEASAEITTIAAALSAQYPDTNKDVRAAVLPFSEYYMGRLQDGPLLALMGAVGFVLLIACANAANLLLARATYRSREMALRVAIGASRGRIVRQLLVESLVLSAIAGACGLVFAAASMRIFIAETIDLNLPYWVVYTFDARVFGFVAAVCVGTALAFGMAPAWQLSKTRAHDALKEGGRGGAGSRRTRRWASTLVVAELALTLILLAGAGLLIRSAIALSDVDQRVNAANVVTARLGFPAAKFATTAQRAAFYERLEERLQGTSAIAEAAIVTALPFIGAASRPLLLDTDTAAPDLRREVDTIGVSDGYFEALSLPLLRGRTFLNTDGLPGHETVIVNERFAQVYSAGVDPIGRRIRLGDMPAGQGPPSWLTLTVVGVSPSVRQSPMSDVGAVVYLPLRAMLAPASTLRSPDGAVMVRGHLDGAALGNLIRDQVRALDPDVALSNIQPLQRLSEVSRWGHRVIGSLMTLFASIALLLSGMGLYAVTAYGVSQRTSEIGIRMALGAQRAEVAWLFLRRTLLHLGIGLAIGILGAIGIGQLIRGVLVRTSPLDPLTLSMTVLTLIVVGIAACLVPARRATRLDPVTTLRHE